MCVWLLLVLVLWALSFELTRTLVRTLEKICMTRKIVSTGRTPLLRWFDLTFLEVIIACFLSLCFWIFSWNYRTLLPSKKVALVLLLVVVVDAHLFKHSHAWNSNCEFESCIAAQAVISKDSTTKLVWKEAFWNFYCEISATVTICQRGDRFEISIEIFSLCSFEFRGRRTPFVVLQQHVVPLP